MPFITNLMNSKRRAIYQSDRGAYYVIRGDKKVYGIKAHFRKTPNGPKKMTVNNANNVPLSLRPMKVGAPKGPRKGTTRVITPGGTVYKAKREANVAAYLRRMSQASPKK